LDLVVAVADPSNYVALDDLEVLFHMPVQPALRHATSSIRPSTASPGRFQRQAQTVGSLTSRRRTSRPQRCSSRGSAPNLSVETQVQ
jgi:hypothetical protein